MGGQGVGGDQIRGAPTLEQLHELLTLLPAASQSRSRLRGCYCTFSCLPLLASSASLALEGFCFFYDRPYQEQRSSDHAA